MENNAAPVQDTSEATENINSTNNSGSQDSSATLDASRVAEYLGTDTKTLEEFTRFTNANGKFDKAFQVLKARISNPEPKPVEQPAQPVQQQAPVQPQQPQQPQQFQQPKPAEGSMSVNEYIAKQYFEGFSKDPKYKQVFDGTKSAELIKEMAGFNVYLTNLDGTINDDGVRKYLDMKAQTIASHQTQITPEASAAPTVDYVQVGETINNVAEARAVLRQDAQLRASGQAGHPSIEKAREFLKNMLNPSAK